MPAEGMLGGYTISGDRVGTDEHPLVRKHLPIDTTVVTTVLEPGVLLKEVEVKGEEDESDKVIEHKYAPWAETDTVAPCAVVDDHRKPSVCSHNGLVHLLLCCHFHHFLYSAACSAENFCSRKSISSMELGQPCEKPYFLPSRYRMMH